MNHIVDTESLPAAMRDIAASMLVKRTDASRYITPRTINRLRHALLRHLGQAPGDWDMWDEDRGTLDASRRVVYERYLYLEEIRSPFNVGAIFRAAESFAIRAIYLSPHCASPNHSRACRSAMGANEIVPWEVIALDNVIARHANIGVFALETGGETMGAFDFPRQGVMTVGSEELGTSAETLAAARQSRGVVSIASGGAKISLNVSISCGIALHHWFLLASGG